PAQIASYIPLGEILVARDGGVVIGHLQIVAAEAGGVFELKNMAVTEERQREGTGRSLVAAAIAHCRARGGHRLIVATATADTGNLRFYQRQGFRMYGIVRDAFGPSNGYPKGAMTDGIPLHDQVFLEIGLQAASR